MILSQAYQSKEYEYYQSQIDDEDKDNITQLMSKKKTRIALCRDRRDLFFMYYFPHFCKYKAPPFHYAMFKDLEFNGYHHLVWEMCRESAKTSLAKMALIVHAICYGYKKNIFYICNKKEDAQHQMLDIAIELQTNERLIEDFGQLFYNEEVTKKKKSERKGAADFITENGISVRAASTGQSLRGQIKGENRPDLLVLDDFENKNTKNSPKETREVIGFIEECRTGIDGVKGDVIYLCNKITDSGSVAYLEGMASVSDNYRLRELKIEINGVPTWPDRDVMTNKERDELNKKIEELGLDRQPYMSIEQRQIDNPNGVYEQEYLNIPMSDSERFFDTEIIDSLIDRALRIKYEEEGKWKIWQHQIPGRNYIMGVDVSQGFGQDSSVITIWDAESWEQVAEFCDSYTGPEELAEEMITYGLKYNTAYVCWEANSIGEAVKVILKDVYPNLHTTIKYDTRSTRTFNNYGFITSKRTKPMILFSMRDAVTKNLITINSVQLLREMKSYNNAGITETSFDAELSNHWDRVMAACIAYEMRKWATFVNTSVASSARVASDKRKERDRNLMGIALPASA